MRVEVGRRGCASASRGAEREIRGGRGWVGRGERAEGLARIVRTSRFRRRKSRAERPALAPLRADLCSPLRPLFRFQIRYSELVRGLKDQNVQLNRRMLAELAANEPYSFKALVDQVKFMRGSA